MTRDEEIPPGGAEEYAGLGQVLSETIYMVTYTWGAFLTEGEAHLQLLVRSFFSTLVSLPSTHRISRANGALKRA